MQDEAYGYDGVHQVIRDAVGTLNTNRTAIGGVPGEEEDFAYDPTGNWLSYRKDEDGSPVLDQSRSNNKDNQVVQINGSSALLAYDRAGNALKVPPGAGGDWSKCFQPVWDAWNRIVEVKDENGDTVQKNAYDGLFRRITKESGGVITHIYWSDRWKPLEERLDSAAIAAKQFLWGERPGHRDELVLRDRDTDGNGSLDERLYATMDYFNGTAILDVSGAVLERYAYSAFGERQIMAADFTPRTTSSYAWDFGFQGQFRDPKTGWYNYGYRFYVPMLGTWINRDPIGEKGGKNIYQFVAENAVNDVDIFGLKCCSDESQAARASWRALMGFVVCALGGAAGGFATTPTGIGFFIGLGAAVICGALAAEEEENMKALVVEYDACVAKIEDPDCECPDGIADDPRNLVTIQHPRQRAGGIRPGRCGWPR